MDVFKHESMEGGPDVHIVAMSAAEREWLYELLDVLLQKETIIGDEGMRWAELFQRELAYDNDDRI